MTHTTPKPADEPWMSSYSVRLGRDNADCIDLVYATVGQHEFQLYPHEAAYLRDLLNAALPPSATPQPQAQPEEEPVRHADGSLHEFTLKHDGKPFRCACGCNVFHKPDRNRPNVYECNACEQRFESE